MKSLAKILATELNPKHDFDRVGNIYTHPRNDADDFFKGDLKSIGHQFYFMANSVKHWVRGGIIGAATGALVGLVVKNPGAGAATGMLIGSRADFAQYLIRGVIIPTAKRISDDAYKRYSYMGQYFDKQ